MTRYVYLIGEADNPVVKIGVSDDPARRVKDLSTGSPWDLRVLWTAPGEEAEEAALHRYFHACHVRREWFDFTGHDPLYAIEDAWRKLKPYAGDLTSARHELESGRAALAFELARVNAALASAEHSREELTKAQGVRAAAPPRVPRVSGADRDTQFLNVVQGEGGVSLSRVARATGASKSVVKDRMERMERRGLVFRDSAGMWWTNS